MSDRTPPEITLEISGGSLTIRTDEAIYKIMVAEDAIKALPQARTPEPKALPPVEPSTSNKTADVPDDWGEVDLSQAPGPEIKDEYLKGDEDYFKGLSQEMFHEVGRLARRLSMSIRDVEIDKVDAIDLNDAGDQLEDAKDQLENVVKMTEKATMKIMDLGEEIQGSIEQAKSIMEQMNTQAPTEDEDESFDDNDEASEKAKAELLTVLNKVADFLSGLDASSIEPLAQEALTIKQDLNQEVAPIEEIPAEPEEPTGPYFSFSLDLVFQTTYELCTNETVKKHIKAMWDAGERAFDKNQMEKALNKIAPDAPDEDNFLNLDLKGVLKALFASCSVDKFKQVLKKMASTADQIFLDQFLPLEAVLGEAPKPLPKPKAPAPTSQAPDPALLERLGSLADKLREFGKKVTPPQLPENLEDILQQAITPKVAGTKAGTNVVDPALRSQLDQTMNGVFSSVNSIIEALSFQDLSGQTIYRIVKLLTDFQIQLLAMVVSFGSKIKSKTTDEKVTTDQSEKMAQEEVDRALANLGVTSEAEEEEASKLDQSSVNDLLDSLGF